MAINPNPKLVQVSFTPSQLQNLRQFLSRVSLKGSEALSYLSILQTLNPQRKIEKIKAPKKKK